MTKDEASPNRSTIDFAAARRALARLEAWRKDWGAASPYGKPPPEALSFEAIYERFAQEIEDPDRRSWLKKWVPPAAAEGIRLIYYWEKGHVDRYGPPSRGNLGRAVEHFLAAEVSAELSPALTPQSESTTRLSTPFRKATLLRDGATCQICGRRFPLPLHAYSMIRKAAQRGSLLNGLEKEERHSAELWYGQHARPPCADHIIPHLWGGPNALWNLWTLCYLCNYWKGSRFIPELVRLALFRLEEGNPEVPLSEAPAAERIRKGIEKTRERTRALRDR